MVLVSPLSHTKQAQLFLHGLLPQVLKKKSPDPPRHPAAASSEAVSHSSGDMCQALTSSPHSILPGNSLHLLTPWSRTLVRDAGGCRWVRTATLSITWAP